MAYDCIPEDSDLSGMTRADLLEQRDRLRREQAAARRRDPDRCEQDPVYWERHRAIAEIGVLLNGPPTPGQETAARREIERRFGPQVTRDDWHPLELQDQRETLERMRQDARAQRERDPEGYGQNPAYRNRQRRIAVIHAFLESDPPLTVAECRRRV